MNQDYTISAKVPAEWATVLDQRAKVEDRTVSQLVRQALREYFELETNGNAQEREHAA